MTADDGTDSGAGLEWIQLLLPDMPSHTELLPWIERLTDAGRFTNFGPLCRQLEGELSRCVSDPVPRGVSVTTTSSGTAALELALVALGLPKNARVLLPSLTFPATATAVVRAGLTPVLCDIDPDSWTMTPGLARHTLESQHGSAIAAALPVAIFGHPIDTEAWDAFTRETGRPVIVDAAGAFGNQAVGETTAAVFSMHATKVLAAGEGGFAAARNDDFIERIRTASNFGFAGEPGLIQTPGTNAKLSEYHAAVALAAVERWPETSKKRRDLAARYAEEVATALADRVALQAGGAPWIRSVFAVRIPGRGNTTSLVDALARRGIEARRWYCPPLHEHPAFACCPLAGDLATTRGLSEELLGLPFHLELTSGDIRRVCTALDEVLS